MDARLARLTFPGVRALVVDDNAALRQFLCHDLAMLEVQADAVSNADETLAALRRESANGRPRRNSSGLARSLRRRT